MGAPGRGNSISTCLKRGTLGGTVGPGPLGYVVQHGGAHFVFFVCPGTRKEMAELTG